MEITARLTTAEIREAVEAWLEVEHAITVPDEFTLSSVSYQTSPENPAGPLTVRFFAPDPKARPKT